MILTVDLGTSAVKAALFGTDGLAGLGRIPVSSSHPAPGRVEQDALGWWEASKRAVAAARQAAGPAAWAAVRALCFSTARQTVVAVDGDGRPLGPALVWSDRRAELEAAELAARLGGPEAVHRLTGVPIDSAAVAPKLAWLARHRPALLESSRWLLGPRDLLVLRLTGRAVTDATVASRSGLYGPDLRPLDELVGSWHRHLPAVLGPGETAGELGSEPGAELGLPGGLPVLLGAGDRACEVLGAGATESCPMVSWGTTANVSAPRSSRPDPVPPGMTVTAGAGGGWLLEAGLSGAGSALAWLGRLTGQRPAELAAAAATSPPGARGVLALAWLEGARAPWWRSDVGGAFAGLDAAQGPADLARAVLEAVALDAARALEAMGPVEELTICGGGATELWAEVLTGVTGRPARRRLSDEAASVGAALVAAAALGLGLELDRLNPAAAPHQPDPELVAFYAARRSAADHLAQSVLSLPALARPPE